MVKKPRAPIRGHDGGALHQEQRHYEQRDNDLSVPSFNIRSVHLSTNCARISFLGLHQLRAGEAGPFNLFLCRLALDFGRFTTNLAFVFVRAKLPDEVRKCALVGHKLRVGAALGNTAVDDREDVVYMGEEMQRVCDEYACFAPKTGLQYVLEDGFADVRIQCG